MDRKAQGLMATFIILGIVGSFVAGIIMTNTELMGARANKVTGNTIIAIDNAYRNIQVQNVGYLPEINLTEEQPNIFNYSQVIKDIANITIVSPQFLCGYELQDTLFGDYTKILTNQSDLGCQLLFQEALSNKVAFNASDMKWYINQTQ